MKAILRDDTVHDERYVTLADAKDYAAAEVAKERERCAKLCERMSAYTGGHGEPSTPSGSAMAKAIRSGKP